MSSRVRDPVSAAKDKSDRKERKHKHRDREREGKSRHRTAEAPVEELGGSHSRKEKDRVRFHCRSCVVDVSLGTHMAYSTLLAPSLQDLERHPSRHSESRDNKPRETADDRAASPR